jgi:hypothetical protein
MPNGRFDPISETEKCQAFELLIRFQLPVLVIEELRPPTVNASHLSVATV